MATVNLHLNKILHNRDRLQELNTKIEELDKKIDCMTTIKTQLSTDASRLVSIEDRFEFCVSKDEMSTLITDLETSIQDILFNNTPRNCNYDSMQDSIDELNQIMTNLISQNDELRRDMAALKKNNNPDAIRVALDTDKKTRVPRIINLKRQ